MYTHTMKHAEVPCKMLHCPALSTLQDVPVTLSCHCASPVPHALERGTSNLLPALQPVGNPHVTDGALLVCAAGHSVPPLQLCWTTTYHSMICIAHP
jgi:hypothetical protein